MTRYIDADQGKGGIFPMDDNDFCSYGERRKNI